MSNYLFMSHTTLLKTSTNYPPLLHEIKDAPQKLFCLGQPLDPNDVYFAIVGTRHPSPYGKQMAEEFAYALAKVGFVIVSGLAYGIDAIAHKATLDAGGRTIAVLGSGFNHITPSCNHYLAEQIQKTGTIITEYDADFAAHKGTFPQRNRIIAGMSIATFVIEAPEKSGALITARLSLEYNRDVLTLPGNITQETSRGCNRLIRDGCAYPITCIEDVFSFMGIGTKTAPTQPSLFLDPTQTKIYDLLKKSPLSIDQLIMEIKMPAPKIICALSFLELKGIVKKNGAYAFITR